MNSSAGTCARLRYSRYFRPTQVKVQQIRRRAARDGIELNLNDDDLAELILQPCHYCRTQAQWPQVNGIDRKDNTFGYVFDNCLPCCAQCNFMKGTMTYVCFLRKCNEIAQTHPRTELCATGGRGAPFGCPSRTAHDELDLAQSPLCRHELISFDEEMERLAARTECL